MTEVNIEDAQAVVIARAVDRIAQSFQRWTTADIVREYIVDGLVALVSEGWQLVPPKDDKTVEAWIWRCSAGHESAHSEVAIQSMVTEPRCTVRLDSNRWCWATLAAKVRPFSPPEIVHQCPPGLSPLMPCCRRTPFEVPTYHRLTIDPSLVTCDTESTEGSIR